MRNPYIGTFNMPIYGVYFAEKSKTIWSANAHKSLQPCQHHIILRTGAVDDKGITVAVLTHKHAHMSIAGIKHQISRLCFTP